MNLTRSLACLIAVTLLLPAAEAASTSGNKAGTPPSRSTAGDAGKKLHALFDEEWEYSLQQDPVNASVLGDRRWNDRWRDVSIEAIEARQQHRLNTLARIRKIGRTALSPGDQLNYDLFIKELESDIEGHQFRMYLLPLNQRGGIQTTDELTELLRFQTVKDYEDWIARMKAFPVRMEQTIALLRTGAKSGMIWPAVVLQRVTGQIEKQIVSEPATSTFYKPFREMPAAIGESDRQRLRQSASETINSAIIPSFRKLQSFFSAEYLPAASPAVGVWQMPQGAGLYAYLARDYTTTSLTPDQIHERGLTEVARIRREMESIMKQTGFTGTLREFFVKLRTDPQFYYKTGPELLTAYQAMAKRIDPNITKLVRTMPRMPYGVIPVPDNIAPDTTTAYYNSPASDGSRPGLYYVNLYRPETRPKYEMMALSLHEAVPGHHLQIAIAQELGEIPKFRRFGGYTAFIEGWGLYAESLGHDMGLYDDPYSKFGQLTYEMWRAVRLVVDTGMHHRKWERQRAIDYFLDNAAKSELDVVNEIDRYITYPGQALAYKIGELKLKELRAKAKEQLGERFDLRDFHDVVLGSGAVPLDILERQVNSWIEGKRRVKED